MNNKKLELEAISLLKNKWEYLYTFGNPKRPFPRNYENDLNNVMLGLTSRYVEKQKLYFAIDTIKELTEKIGGYSFIDVDNKLKELEQKLSEL